MFVSRMYKLEKVVKSYKSNESLSNEHLTLEICDLSGIRLSSPEVLEYIRGAVAISYTDMLEHIEYYRSHFMDEGESLFFIDGLSKQYNLPGNLVVKRFHNVACLYNSLYYRKKMEELYCNNKTNVKILSK